MEIRQCAFGHFYDASVSPRCPYCGGREGDRAEPAVILPEMLNRPTNRDERPAHGAASPVVGWLVCLSGAERGRSRELYNGNNFIGRDGMGRLVEAEPGLHREWTLVVTYDRRDRAFFCGLAGGREVVRLNGRPMSGTSPLSAGDRLEVGDTPLLFVPLCGEAFDWDRAATEPSD